MLTIRESDNGKKGRVERALLHVRNVSIFEKSVGKLSEDLR